MATKKKPARKADPDVKRDLAFVTGDSEESHLARGLYGINTGQVWSGIHLLPPDSILEEIVNEFKKKTDIPLEIPYMFVLEMLLTHLISKEITIKLPGVKKPLECDASAIIVADSGSSKTVATAAISEAFNLQNLIWESHAVSSAKWMEELCGVENDGEIITESNNRKVLFIDEFPEWFLAVRTPSSPMGDTYRDVLQVYDNKPVGRDTVKKKVYCEKPVINIVGLGPYETFVQELTVKDLVSGLIFRFAVIRAKADPKRPLCDYPIYKIKLNSRKFKKLLEEITCGQYVVTSKVEKRYNQLFASLTKDSDLPTGFLRRVMWRMHKYALAYHLILGGGGKQNISAVAYSWAARLTALCINDYAAIVREAVPGLRALVEKVEQFMAVRMEQNKPCNARDLIAGVRGIESIPMAEGLLRIAQPSIAAERNRAVQSKIPGGKPLTPC